MRLLIVTLTATVLMSACGRQEDAAGNSAAATVQEPTPSNLTDDPQNSVVPVGNGMALVPNPTPLAITEIPAAFRGRWGLNANDCDPSRADNKGLMTVTADRLAFYESRAAPRGLKVAGSKLTGTLDFIGEGQSWQEPADLTLLEDGRTLVRDTPDQGALRYARCL